MWGPATNGETAIVTLNADSMLMVTGRVRTQEGEPIKNSPIKFDLFCIGDSERTQSVFVRPDRTDAQGGFVLNVDRDEVAFGDREMEIAVIDIADSQVKTATIALPVAGSDDALDVGLVTLKGPTLFVAGRVVTSSGGPLPNAAVQVQYRRNQLSSSTRSFLDSRSDSWGTAGLKGKTDQDGSFHLNTSWRLGSRWETRLMVSMPGFTLLEPVAFRPGDSNLTLIMHGSGCLQGSIRQPEAIGDGQVFSLVEVVVNGPSGTGKTVTDDRARSALESGRVHYTSPLGFRADGLVPGRYQVQLRSRHDGIVLFSAGDVSVREDHSTKDPRLQSVDLRGRLRQIQVIAECSDKTKLIYADVLVRSVAEGSIWNKVPGKPGLGRVSWSLTVGAPPVDLCLRPQGFRMRILRGVTEDVTVTLLPETSIRVTLHDHVSIPPPGIRLVVRLRRVDSAFDWPVDSRRSPSSSFYHQSGTFGLDRHVRVHTSGPGVYRLTLWLLERQIPCAYVLIGGVQPETVRVSEKRNGPPVTVTVDPESLSDALKTLRQ